MCTLGAAASYASGKAVRATLLQLLLVMITMTAENISTDLVPLSLCKHNHGIRSKAATASVVGGSTGDWLRRAKAFFHVATDGK